MTTPSKEEFEQLVKLQKDNMDMLNRLVPQLNLSNEKIDQQSLAMEELRRQKTEADAERVRLADT